MNRLAALCLATALTPAFALADERPYAFTYEPVVSAGGERELELYETLSEPRSGQAVDRVWEHKLEFGYGVTDRLTVSAYGVFRTTGDQAFQFSAGRLEGRYKLVDAGASPVDVVLYLEVEKEVVDDKPFGLEEKVILGRNYGPWSWAANLVAEQEWPVGGGSETKWGWSVGSALKVNDRVRLGVETFGERVHDAAGLVTLSSYAGPTGVLTLPSGPFNSAWLIVGAGFGLREVDDRLQARVVLGGDF